MIEFDPKAVDARYTYDLVKDGKRIETFTTWRPHIGLFPTEKIVVTDSIAKEKDGRPMTWILNSRIDIDEWHDKLARDLQWYTQEPDTPIRPKHHRDVVPGYEYAEVMMYLLDDPGSFLLGTAYGYMFRAGKKEGNTVEQEMAKAQWYFDYYHAWLKNGKKVTRIKDIQSILKG